MALPDFPCEELAKLVLGYLAEEQLMTVYDEFLQSSPYLDAAENEYKRILMRSLRSILAEYWAVKVFVERCKPFALRKKLSQCHNLLDVVKFLLNNVDLKKVLTNNNWNKNGTGAQTNRECSLCGISREHCGCKTNTSMSSLEDNSSTKQNSYIETTSLNDLPGNLYHPNKRKHANSNEKANFEVDERQNQTSCNEAYLEKQTHNETNFRENQPNLIPMATLELVNKQDLGVTNYHKTPHLSSDTGPNTKKVVKVRSKTICNRDETQPNIIPDSSTSDNLNTLHQINKNDITAVNIHDIIHIPAKSQYMFKVSTNANSLVSHSNNVLDNSSGSESKIKIISDVKVNTAATEITPRAEKRSRVPKVVETTPCSQMQTIMINGTPAYMSDMPKKASKFTKDEIMSMPTLILVTAAGPPPIPMSSMTSIAPLGSQTTCTNSSLLTLAPSTLTTISENDVINIQARNDMPALSGSATKAGTTQMFDVKNFSVPKDSTVSTEGKISTPQVLPALRKASSTPRRTSHIRVLDFTTPRRILNEGVNEGTVEVLLSRSPNMQINDDSIKASTNVLTTKEETIMKTPQQLKETVKKESNLPKKWDTDLRMLAVASMQDTKNVKTAPRSHKRKKPVTDTPKDDKNTQQPKTYRNKAGKKNKDINKNKSKDAVTLESADIEDKSPIAASSTVKPTIKIITDWNTHPNIQEEKIVNSQPKLPENTERDTPEVERGQYHNSISAKLNISDLLETPYKQALYDIQMDTPKFLRPDIPISDEPVSEIKITDIPTPRFFEAGGFSVTPKATPTYPNRPTDYSSGGSYYKPDEQDYIPQFDDICVVTNPIPKTEIIREKTKETSQTSNKKSTRPVRKCTKNVSYRDKNASKVNDPEISSNDTSLSFNDNAVEEVDKHSERKSLSKSDVKKKPRLSKSRKSPSKKTTPKAFMKIKPRRATPVKNSKRKSSAAKTSSRKSTSSKEKLHATPLTVPVTTKSRRKSSTPRKLHTKYLDNLDNITIKDSTDKSDQKVVGHQDSDTENIPLRWSDDCSQEAKPKDVVGSAANEAEDICKIKEYIEKTMSKEEIPSETDTQLHVDLIKRGFDVETAKSIERDLLDLPPPKSDLLTQKNVADPATKESYQGLDKELVSLDASKTTDSECNVSNPLLVVESEEDEVEEIELSVCEKTNYIICEHEETKNMPKSNQHRIVDNFNMEFCMDDLTIRLRLSPYIDLFEMAPEQENLSIQETETAVSSIPNFDRLYTPLKDPQSSIQAQYREIFDSTLTSLDTPLKSNDPDKTITEIVLEVEQIDEKEEERVKSAKKRKRIQSGSCSDEPHGDSKRNRRETRYMPNIQNIDIETVLSKLHGP